MKIVMATKNRKKIHEMKRICSGLDMEFLSLASFPGCPETEEDRATFRANALKKAVTVAGYTGLPAIADDSGLEVYVLGGAPGVFSARYAGEPADDQNNVKKLLREMRNVSDPARGARFVCCIALALPDGHKKTFTGTVDGRIGKRQKGIKGFGYDPVFYPAGQTRTFAEMTGPEKDALSHRGKALRKLYAYLRKTCKYE